jgi:sulfite exporter TauE/SafE
LFLIAEGAFSTGWVARPFATGTGCPGVSTFAALLRAPNLSSVFVAGLVNGLLPCGLVYAYLALAASSGNVFAGTAVMALFGLGTLPALILTGMSGSLLSHVWRRRCFRIAAICMILTGCIAVWRGASFGLALVDGATDCAPCPGCISSSTESE